MIKTKYRWLQKYGTRQERLMTDSGSPPPTFDELLKLARQGDAGALGELLQNHRHYLLLIANKELDENIRRKIGASDVVQESLLTAHLKFEQFGGKTKPELLAWLRTILINDLRHAWRTFKGTQKRQVDRERPLQINSSLEQPLVDAQMTPQTNALVAEEAVQLQSAMSFLSKEHQQVLRLHNWQQKEFGEIGLEMGRSAEAARKLWLRAILKLKESIKKSQQHE